MEKVDRRREKIFRYIQQRLSEGISPTVREIGEQLGIPSTSTVHNDLKYLVSAGYIQMTDGRNRTIRLPGSAGARVPVLGTVTAGPPVLAMQNIEEYIPLAVPGRRSDALFALHVRGDSMIQAAIADGDLVIVERTPTAENGEIVVAMIDNEATVKRYYRENGHFRLQPENDAYAPILADEVEILGKVVAVLRYY